MKTCIAIATTTGRPCRNPAIPGGKLCPFHEAPRQIELVGGPRDGESVSVRDAKWSRTLVAVADGDAGVNLYRPDPHLVGTIAGRYHLEYVDSSLVWRWERDSSGVEAVR